MRIRIRTRGLGGYVWWLLSRLHDRNNDPEAYVGLFLKP